MTFSRILWPSDGSQPALRALRTAIELAETFQADLFALQAVPRVPLLSETGFASPGPSVVDVQRYEQHLLQEMKKNLERTIAELVPGDITVETVVLLGEAMEVILDFVRRQQIDLIVMATHARTGFAHFFLGSVAERVIRSAPVPILVVPAPPGQR